MHADLFNELYSPLSVKFGCYVVAEMPSDILSNVLKNPQQDAEDAMAIALEYHIARHFFVQLLNQTQLLEKFDCSQEQYNQRHVPTVAIESARKHKKLMI